MQTSLVLGKHGAFGDIIFFNYVQPFETESTTMYLFQFNPSGVHGLRETSILDLKDITLAMSIHPVFKELHRL